MACLSTWSDFCTGSLWYLIIKRGGKKSRNCKWRFSWLWITYRLDTIFRGWTSIRQLYWGSPVHQNYSGLTHPQFKNHRTKWCSRIRHVDRRTTSCKTFVRRHLWVPCRSNFNRPSGQSVGLVSSRQYPIQSKELGLPKQPSFVQALFSTKLGSHALTLMLN